MCILLARGIYTKALNEMEFFARKFNFTHCCDNFFVLNSATSYLLLCNICLIPYDFD